MRRTIRAFGRVAAVSALSTMLASCFWPVPGQGPNRQAHNSAEDAIGVDTVASLTMKWQVTVDEGAVGDVVTSAGGVHVDDRRAVYGFHPATGARNWRYGVTAPLEVSSPWVVGDDLVVSQWNPTATSASDPAASDATTRLDPSTGAVRGDVDPGVVVATRENEVLMSDFRYLSHPRLGQWWVEDLRLTDVDTSAERCCVASVNWHGTGPGVPVPAMPNWWATEATVGQDLILNAGLGILNNATPSVGWGNGVRGFTISTTATACPGQVVVCPAWIVPLDGGTSTAPVLTDDQTVAYVGTDAGTLYAVSFTATTASVLWSQPVGAAVTDSPALANGSLYVPTAAGDLVVLDAATGELEWVGSIGGELQSAVTQQPAVAGGVVFVGLANGTVHAFDAAGCGEDNCDDPLWSAATGSQITGAPAVSQGQLYVGTEDGRLVAFGL